MGWNTWRMSLLVIVGTVLAVVLANACSHALPASTPPAPVVTLAPPRVPAAVPAPLIESIPEAAAVHYPLPTTQSIYFDLDDAALPKAALDELSNFGFRLLARPDLQLLIEGFCDERGSTEYNIALGQRRADAAKNYLITFGVPSTRIRAMSWGKDKPKAVGHNEQAWKLNRRIDFTVKG